MNPPQYKIVDQIKLSKFLLNLAGSCNIPFNRNFAAEIIEIECKREREREEERESRRRRRARRASRPRRAVSLA